MVYLSHLKLVFDIVDQRGLQKFVLCFFLKRIRLFTDAKIVADGSLTLPNKFSIISLGAKPRTPGISFVGVSKKSCLLATAPCPNHQLLFLLKNLLVM